MFARITLIRQKKKSLTAHLMNNDSLNIVIFQDIVFLTLKDKKKMLFIVNKFQNLIRILDILFLKAASHKYINTGYKCI